MRKSSSSTTELRDRNELLNLLANDSVDDFKGLKIAKNLLMWNVKKGEENLLVKMIQKNKRNSALFIIQNADQQVLNSTNASGWSPMMIASGRGDLGLVSELVARGADIHAGGYFGAPIHLAAYSSAIPVLSFLLEHGVGINSDGCCEWKPLHYCVFSVNKQIEHGLGEPPTDRPRWGAVSERAKMIQFLCDRGAILNPEDFIKDTPLHLATSFADSISVDTLINNGANINYRNKYGDTPLHTAARREQKENIETLMKRGALSILVNAAGLTPADISRQIGREDIANLIEHLQQEKFAHSRDRQSSINNEHDNAEKNSSLERRLQQLQQQSDEQQRIINEQDNQINAHRDLIQQQQKIIENLVKIVDQHTKQLEGQDELLKQFLENSH